MKQDARVVIGDEGTVVWDQTHAAALDRLRNADAFILVTWADLKHAGADLMVLAKDGGQPVLLTMIQVAATALVEAYDDASDL